MIRRKIGSHSVYRQIHTLYKYKYLLFTCVIKSIVICSCISPNFFCHVQFHDLPPILQKSARITCSNIFSLTLPLDLQSSLLCTCSSSFILSHWRLPLCLKGGSTQEVNNFRPISLLLIFDKIMEKIMYKKLYHFLEENNILFKKQFGFRKNNLTVYALIKITEKIKKSIDSGLYGCGIFIDLRSFQHCQS